MHWAKPSRGFREAILVREGDRVEASVPSECKRLGPPSCGMRRLILEQDATCGWSEGIKEAVE